MLASIEILTYIITSTTSFCLGMLVGWGIVRNSERISPEELRRIIAIVILAVYLVSVLADIAIPEYSTPILLHAIMGGIVGYLFSSGEDFNFTLKG